MGWKAPSDIIESEGYDIDETYERIAADQRRIDALGIRLGKFGEQPPPPAETDDQPPPQEEEKEQA